MRNLLALILLLTCALLAESAVDCVALMHRLNVLRQDAKSAQSSWDEQRLALEANLKELRGQLEVLQASLKQSSERNAVLRKELSARRAQLEGVRQSLQAMLPGIRAMESQLLALRPSLPQPLSTQLDAIYQRLSARRTELLQLPAMLQDIATAVTEINDYQSRIHLARLVLPDAAGQRREHQVAYLGLSWAYASTDDGGSAGYGIPTPQGWEWHWTPQWSAAIREALDIAAGNAPAKVLSLPLKEVAK